MAVYRRALAYFRPDWRLLLVVFALTGLSTSLGLVASWPMAVLVDTVLAQPGTAASNDWIHRLFRAVLPADRAGQILTLALIGFGVKVGSDVLSAVQTVLTHHVHYNGLVRVRSDLFRKLQSMGLAYHRNQPQGDAIYRLSSDSYGCQTILTVVTSSIVALLTLAVMTLVLGSRSVTLTLLAFSIAPVLAVLNTVYGRRLKRRSMDCKEQDTRFTTTVQRSMAGISLTQAFCREPYEFDRFHDAVRGTIRAWWRLNREQLTYNLLVGTVFAVGGAVVFGYGGYLVYRDQFLSPRPNGMTAGDLIIFTSYLGLLWGPLCNLTGFAANVQGGVAGAERVFEVLDREPHVVEAPDAVPMPRRPRTLALSDVVFSYTAGRPVLRGMTACIRPGQMVAFVGSSGVGKSTLLNLLPRFYDPTAGALLLDGIDARQIRLTDLRRHVAVVSQESLVLPTTIAENLAYGRPDATPQQIRHAARLAGAAEFIEALPQGYDTEITENGANLSGGQRQRLGIARAILSEAPILVLDEPTSALDAHHERQICQTLRSLKGDRTIVMVSHRLSTVIDCDQIFVVHDGRVVEQGSHYELLARGGIYTDLAGQSPLSKAA